MAKKLVVVLSIIIIILAAVLYFMTRPSPVVFSDEPEDWVKKDGQIRKIDLVEATEGASRIDPNGQQYETDTIGTVFKYEGWYKGNHFKNFYSEDERTVIRITQNLNPTDGIMEGFIMERIEDGKPYLYIFLDADWRASIPDTMIYWGSSHQLEQSFDFNQEVSDGIYMNKIEDDESRFENNYVIHKGGVWVGELKEDETSTIISLA